MLFYGGQRVPTSGIYRVTHTFHREHDGEIALIAGKEFPQCSTECSDVIYVLIQAAPGQQEDNDLKQKEEPKGKRSATGD